MLLEDILWLVLSAVVARAVWRMIGGAMSVARGQASREPSRGGVPAQGVQMARDPVCGTYVVPDRALAVLEGSRHVFFCSTSCRDQYRASAAARRSGAEGRTA